MNVFDEMMSRYEIISNEDYKNAQHEVMQQIALAGLYRGGFFRKAAFYGGTCLRIFYGLKRFSEDMDFSLLKRESGFSLQNYFEPIINEFKALGRDVIIEKKSKTHQTNVESAFLKDDTAIYNLQFRTERRVKIKIEVDTDPPQGFSTEPKLILLPFSFMTHCYTLPDLYAGKMHALLFRTWKNRVKGRDWYDFEWYIRNNIELNMDHLNKRIKQTKPDEEALSQEGLKKLLKEKILQTNINWVKDDVRPFMKNPEDMNIWSWEYFAQLVDRIQFKS